MPDSDDDSIPDWARTALTLARDRNAALRKSIYSEHRDEEKAEEKYQKLKPYVGVDTDAVRERIQQAQEELEAQDARIEEGFEAGRISAFMRETYHLAMRKKKAHLATHMSLEGNGTPVGKMIEEIAQPYDGLIAVVGAMRSHETDTSEDYDDELQEEEHDEWEI